jgi:DNA polymerase I
VQVYINPSQEIINNFNPDIVSFDIETTGLDPYLDKILMLQFASRDEVLIFTKALPQKMKAILQNKLILGHNLAFDYKFMKVKFGIELKNVWDTMIVESRLNLGRQLRVGLGYTVERRLGIKLDKTIRKRFISRPDSPFTADELDYAAKDVYLLFPIYDQQNQAVKDAGMEKVIQIENNAVPITGELELNGIALNLPDWYKIVAKEEERLLEVCHKIYNLLPQKPPVHISLFAERRDEIQAYIKALNINSSTEVPRIIRTFGFTVSNADSETLESIKSKCEFARLMLEFRGLYKQLGTYLWPLPTMIHNTTGRFHTRYTQIALFESKHNKSGTATGRYSCKYIHQIPRSPEMRHCFVARPGHLIVTADYSNQEQRIAANLTEEPALIEFFNSDFNDYHGFMCAKIFDMPLDQVAKMVIDGVEVDPPRGDLRHKAKTLNLASMYLISKVGLAKQLGITEDEAQVLLDQYHERLPKLMGTLVRWGAQAVKDRFVSDKRLGGIRYFESEVEDWKIPRAAANFPVQGLAALQMKLALRMIYDEIPEATILMSVHDEAVVEFPEEATWVPAKVQEVMSKAASIVCGGPIPYTVGIKVMPSWTK